MNETQQEFTTSFSQQELLAYKAMRASYEQDHDRFTRREWAHIEFLRWLYHERFAGSQPEDRGESADEPSRREHGPRGADADA
jgi:hypothetical protein